MEERPRSFEDLIQQNSVPVLVDFWAEWCSACKMLSPTVQQLAKEFKGKMLTIKVNVEKNKMAGTKYQITGIPTLMLFHQGKILMRLSGAMPLSTLRQEIQKHIE